MATDLDSFGAVPAWRIARLRVFLKGVVHRARTPEDSGEDLTHRAARRVFQRERSKAQAPARGGTKRTFGAALQDIMYSCLIPGRLAGLAASDIHRNIVRRCEGTGERPPVVSTITSWYWRRCPEEIQHRLGIVDPPLPVGDLKAIAASLGQRLAAAGAPLDPPVVVDAYPQCRSDTHRWPSIALFDPGLALWWIISPAWDLSYAAPPRVGVSQDWYLHWSSSTSPTSDLDYHRRSQSYWDAIKPYNACSTATMAAAFLQYREVAVRHISPIGRGAAPRPAQVMQTVTLPLPDSLANHVAELLDRQIFGSTVEEVCLFLIRSGLMQQEVSKKRPANGATSDGRHRRPTTARAASSTIALSPDRSSI